MTTPFGSFVHHDPLMYFVQGVNLNTGYDASTLYQMLLSDAQDLIPCQRAMVYVFQEQTQELLPVASRASSCSLMGGEAILVSNGQVQDELLGRISLQDTNSLVAWAARHRHPLLHRCAQASCYHTGNGACSEIAVPLIAKNIVYGVLVLQRSEPFHRQELRHACDLGHLAAMAIENIELFQRMRSDQEQLRTMLATIAHELRSPLNTINGYLELTLSGAGGKLNAQQQEFVQRARMGSEHLYALLENILLISRADTSHLRLNRDIISLQSIIADAVEELELTAADQQMTMRVEIAEHLPRLYADAVRLQQLLRNLLMNALQFTPHKGEIVISADTQKIMQDIYMEEPMQMIRLQVIDRGIGIDPLFHERIFERFFQVTSQSERRAGGQGLGLAVVKIIVELHGGSVKVESVPGEGSIFTCMLPCLVS